MSSQRRIEASRANGALSRGPVTPEGKARSARNSLRHGLLAANLVLEAEAGDAFENMLDGFSLRLQPAGDVEASLVEEMTVSVWRQRRCWAIERAMVDDAAARSLAPEPVARMAAAYAELAAGPGLPLIHRYETRLNRSFQRALNNLLLLRKQKMPNEPNPISEHGLASPKSEDQDIDSSSQPVPAPAGVEPAEPLPAPVTPVSDAAADPLPVPPPAPSPAPPARRPVSPAREPWLGDFDILRFADS